MLNSFHISLINTRVRIPIYVDITLFQSLLVSLFFLKILKWTCRKIGTTIQLTFILVVNNFVNGGNVLIRIYGFICFRSYKIIFLTRKIQSVNSQICYSVINELKDNMNITTEDFWNKYINEDIMEIFDFTCDFFSKELPKEFIEDYDAGEVILETKGQHEETKEFDKVLKFTKLLQEKQPKLYKEYFQYFDDFLVDYYCFHNEADKVEKSFSNFMLKPVHDFDHYLMSFKKLLFYGYTNILDHAIIKNFEEVNTSDKLMGNASYDLAVSKFYITLEEYYPKSNHQV